MAGFESFAPPAACPVCTGSLRVERLRCADCATALEGRFAAEPLAVLSAGERAFAEAFLLAGGNLKVLGEMLGVSYPTLRARLDELLARLRALKGYPAATPAARAEKPPTRAAARRTPEPPGDALGRKEKILALIESGAISAAEGKARLRGEKIK